jgi:hypothetical protein
MKHERPELPFAGMNRGRQSVKILGCVSTAAADSAAVSRCRNLLGVDAMILRHENFGKGSWGGCWELEQKWKRAPSRRTELQAPSS